MSPFVGRSVRVILFFAVVVGAAAVFAWRHYDYPHIWGRDDPSPPYFAFSGEEVTQRLGNRFICERSPLGETLRCDTTPNKSEATFLASGLNLDWIESIHLDAQRGLGGNDWVELAIGFLPSDHRASARRWARQASRQRGTTTTYLGGFSLTLVAKEKRGTLTISSPGAHESGTFDFTVRKRGFFPPPDPERIEPLVERYAPILRFSEGESFFPLDVDSYIKFSRACFARLHLVRSRPFSVYDAPQFDSCVDPTDADHLDRNAECESQDQCFVTLVPRVESRRSLKGHLRIDSDMRDAAGHRYPIYWHVERISLSRLVLEYWFFYSFNDYKNRHEGDWEWIGIDVELPAGSVDTNIVPPSVLATSAAPVKVFYSSHHDGWWRRWDEMLPNEQRQDTHPIVRVARGSHANYFTSRDDFKVKECEGLLCFGDYDDALGNFCQVDPSRELVHMPDRGFPGVYGPENYLARSGEVAGAGPADPRTSSTGDFRYPEGAFQRAIHDDSKGVAAPRDLDPC